MSARPCTTQCLTQQPTLPGGTTELACWADTATCTTKRQSWQCLTFAFMDAAASDGGMLQWQGGERSTDVHGQFHAAQSGLPSWQVSIWRRLLYINHPPEVEHFAPEKLPNPNRKVVFQLPFFRGELLNFGGYSKKGRFNHQPVVNTPCEQTFFLTNLALTCEQWKQGPLVVYCLYIRDFTTQALWWSLLNNQDLMESNRLLFVAHVNNQLLVDEIGFFPYSPCVFWSEFWVLAQKARTSNCLYKSLFARYLQGFS